MLETHFDASRLDSWKEIAAYLHRDVRTAIRWGKERGLPIHRVPGGKRQSVFGYTHEIDAWLRSQSRDGIEEPFAESDNPLERGAGSAPTESAASPVIRDNVWLLRRNPWIVAACVVGLIFMGTLFLGSLRSAPIRPMGLRRITDDGNGKGNLRTDGKTLYFTEAQGARSVLAADPLSGSPVRFIKTPFSNVSLQDLSSDGKTLLILSYDGIIIAGPLWTMPAQGGDPRRV